MELWEIPNLAALQSRWYFVMEIERMTTSIGARGGQCLQAPRACFDMAARAAYSA